MSETKNTEAINLVTGNPIDTSKMTEIAPGHYVSNDSSIPPGEFSRCGIAKLTRIDGKWHESFRLLSGQERVTKKLMTKLGINLNYRIVRALILGGLVKGSRPSPFVTMVDMADLAKHIAKTSKPGFWTKERRAAYQKGWQECQSLQESDD